MTGRPFDPRAITRRHFYRDCGVGLGKIALASLLVGPNRAQAGPTDPLTPRPPHFAPKAKRVIYLFMAGAPSQLDLFDHKPALVKFDGKPVPAEVVKDQRYAFIQPDASLMASRFRFGRHGKSGRELSEMLPHLAKVVDDIAVVKSVHTDQFNHAPAQILVNTGSSLPGRPSMGSWVTYGLGSEASRPPRVRRPELGRRDQRRRGELVVRVPARRVSGGPVPIQGGPDPQRRQPPGGRRPTPARHDRPGPGAQPSHLDAVGDPEIEAGSPRTNWPTGCRPAPRT